MDTVKKKTAKKVAPKGDNALTIFISLASYREPELRDTIVSALENAEFPNRVHFGVFSQVEEGEHPDLSDIPNLVEEVVNASQAKGPGYARAKVMEQYDGEDFFLQVDAHSVFPKNWDSDALKLYRQIQRETGETKVVISFWAKPYHIDESGKKILGVHTDKKWDVDVPHYTQLVRYGGAYIGNRVAMPEGLDYHESACILGGYILATGDLVEEVPYDPDICWTGEEAMFSVRAYTRGWKIYSPRQILLYHNYERHGNPRVWGDNPEWDFIELEGRIKMYQRLNLSVKDIWGIGDERLYKKYMHDHAETMSSKATAQLDYARRQLNKLKMDLEKAKNTEVSPTKYLDKRQAREKRHREKLAEQAAIAEQRKAIRQQMIKKQELRREEAIRQMFSRGK